jgi:hypothetical protein
MLLRVTQPGFIGSTFFTVGETLTGASSTDSLSSLSIIRLVLIGLLLEAGCGPPH